VSEGPHRGNLLGIERLEGCVRGHVLLELLGRSRAEEHGGKVRMRERVRERDVRRGDIPSLGEGDDLTGELLPGTVRRRCSFVDSTALTP
jgi:hypothetical protein